MTARTSAETARDIPEATVARLPVYLRALTGLSEAGTRTCSSEDLATAAGVNSAKLRKDLSYLGSYGTRGVGYEVAYLVYQIRRELGLTHDWPVVIVGAGNLGQALVSANARVNDQDSIVRLVGSQRDAVSGVSLDEEMADLVRFNEALERRIAERTAEGF